MKQTICALNQSVDVDPLLDKDIWLASDVGLKPDATQGIYYLHFSKITTQWLKRSAMKFLRL